MARAVGKYWFLIVNVPVELYGGRHGLSPPRVSASWHRTTWYNRYGGTSSKGPEKGPSEQCLVAKTTLPYTYGGRHEGPERMI
jgi:hypothetical protein